jgi:hypothetical protein
MNSDQEHLRLLAIFHYIMAGLTACMACFSIIYMVVGIMFLTQPDMFKGPPNQPPPPPEVLEMAGFMMVGFSALMVALGWIYAFCLFLTGKNLSNRRRYTFCMIIAGISCLFVPLGTALGVFTIVVLLRPSVKTLFEERQFTQLSQ